jgi:hypothetical protein
MARNLNEITDKILVPYVKKASVDAAKQFNTYVAEAARKFNKRYTGLAKARKKLGPMKSRKLPNALTHLPKPYGEGKPVVKEGFVSAAEKFVKPDVDYHKKTIRIAKKDPGRAVVRTVFKPVVDIKNAQKKVIKKAAKVALVGASGVAGWAVGSELYNSYKPEGDSLNEANLALDVYSRIDTYKKMGFKVKDVNVSDTKASFVVIDKDGVMKKHVFNGNKRSVVDMGTVKQTYEPEDEELTVEVTPKKRGRGRPPGSKNKTKVVIKRKKK